MLLVPAQTLSDFSISGQVVRLLAAGWSYTLPQGSRRNAWGLTPRSSLQPVTVGGKDTYLSLSGRLTVLWFCAGSHSVPKMKLQVLRLVTCLKTHPSLAAFRLLTPWPQSVPVTPENTSQVDCFHLSPCLRVFGGDPGVNTVTYQMCRCHCHCTC